MNCSFKDCPGIYEPRTIVHTVRHHGQVVVFDHVPAEICSLCGDVLLAPETVRRLEEVLREGSIPHASAPVYEYPAA